MSYRTFFLLLLVLICWNCAQQGSPTGGPRDEDPPEVVACEPPNYSVQFEARKITITFDEFIVLDNVNQELIVSPPMEEKPEVKLRKKSLIIEFKEVLKDSTTYTFNFGSAIKDLHEGNKLLNYEYVFSTGNVLDSLSVKGTLKYAFDLTEPEDPFSIMLYRELEDSVPMTEIPLYVGRSDDSGVFSVNNLRPDTFKVFVLKDGNNNFLFDLPTEEIAFLDSNLIVNAEFARQLFLAAELSDTTLKMQDKFMTDTQSASPDSLGIAATSDSLGIATVPDSLDLVKPDLNSVYIDLLLFTEETEVQYLTDYNRDHRRKMEMVFARPLTDSFYYAPVLTNTTEPVELLEYFSANRDSLTLWILDSADYKRDTLHMEIRFTVSDTANQYVTQKDTLLFSYREKNSRKKNAAPGSKEPEKLEVLTIRKGAEMDLNRELGFDLNYPLRFIQDSLISLYFIKDTVEIPEPFITYADSSRLSRGWISAGWQSASQYRLVLYPGAISSIYPLDHDTLDVTFKTRDIEYYGKILLNLENVRDRVVVQLINKDKVVREKKVDVSGLITFDFLVPQDYKIKVIHDRNRNGKWDTGKYIEHRQPESVELLPKPITVRSNWDHDVTLRLEK